MAIFEICVETGPTGNDHFVEYQSAADYPNRLMRTLARATSREFNMTLKVVDMQFQVEDEDQAWFLNSTWSASDWSTDNALTDLEFIMDRKAAQQAETARKYNLRRDALAKLTAEEKELLNLK